MFQLSDSSHDPQPIGNLIKASQYQGLLTSQELIAAAQSRSEQILDDAQHEWERQREAGFQAGRLLAQESAAEMAIGHQQRLLTHLAQIRQQLTEIVIQAVTKIVGDLPVVELVERLIDKALAELVGQNRVTLLIHPDNLAAVDQLSQKLCSHHGIGLLELQSDPRVPLHTCVLSTPKQVIDASLEVQFSALRHLLTRTVADNEAVDTK